MHIVHRRAAYAGAHRNRPVRRLRCSAGLAVVGHLQTGNGSGVAQAHQGPVVRVRVLAVQDGFEMEMAACRGPRGPDLSDEFPHLDRLALLHTDALKVVVGGDQAVAVIDFHPVAAAPGMPPHCPHHAGIRRINVGSAGGSKVLAPVEFACRPVDGTCPQAKM